MDSKRMRDRSHVFDNDELNNLCFFRRAKGKTLTENFIIAYSTYIYTHVVTICSIVIKKTKLYI